MELRGNASDDTDKFNSKCKPVHYSMRSEEHTSELQSRPHISYAVFCLKKKKNNK